MTGFAAPQAEYLFNPAFSGLVIRQAALEHFTHHEEGLSLAKAFLVLPMTLYEPIRKELPMDVKTKLHPWVQKRPQLQLNFPRIARSFVQFGREGILFAQSRGVLTVTTNATIVPGELNIRPYDRATQEVTGILAAAKFVGRWLGYTGTDETTYAAWGIAP